MSLEASKLVPLALHFWSDLKNNPLYTHLKLNMLFNDEIV